MKQERLRREYSVHFKIALGTSELFPASGMSIFVLVIFKVLPGLSSVLAL